MDGQSESIRGQLSIGCMDGDVERGVGCPQQTLDQSDGSSLGLRLKERVPCILVVCESYKIEKKTQLVNITT